MFLIFVLHLCEIEIDGETKWHNPFEDLQEYGIMNCMDQCKEKYHFCKDKLECTLDCINRELRECIPQNIMDKCQNECISLQGCPRRNKCVIQCLVEHHKGELDANLKYYDEHEVDDSFFMIIGSIIMGLMIFIFLSYICISDEGNERRRR